MLKRSLARTNPYLADPAKRRDMFKMTVSTSTDVEGVTLLPSDLASQSKRAHRIKSSRGFAKSV